LLACGVGLALLLLVDNPLVRLIFGAGIGLAAHFMVASIVAAYLVYDASDLYKLAWWPGRCLRREPADAILVHAGFDPASSVLQTKYPQMRLRILDFFAAGTTTEPSIQRAHRLMPPTAREERIAANAWPVDNASQDVVFALSAAHELRRPEERVAFFREARRVLRTGGRVIVIEQLRNVVNFACFGVAAFHFLSRRTWLQAFDAAGLAVVDEFRITPFMRAFVLEA